MHLAKDTTCHFVCIVCCSCSSLSVRNETKSKTQQKWKVWRNEHETEKKTKNETKPKWKENEGKNQIEITQNGNKTILTYVFLVANYRLVFITVFQQSCLTFEIVINRASVVHVSKQGLLPPENMPMPALLSGHQQLFSRRSVGTERLNCGFKETHDQIYYEKEIKPIIRWKECQSSVEKNFRNISLKLDDHGNMILTWWQCNVFEHMLRGNIILYFCGILQRTRQWQMRLSIEVLIYGELCWRPAQMCLEQSAEIPYAVYLQFQHLWTKK